MNVPIGIVDENGNFKRLVIGSGFVGQLIEMMRQDGPTEIQTMGDDGNLKTYEAHALLVTAKGSKGSFMYMPDKTEAKENEI